MSDRQVIVGIDIGATKTQMACLDASGLNVFFREPTPQEPRRAIEMIERGIRETDLPGPLAGIGIGCPGPLDQEAGVVQSPPNLRAWKGFRIKALLEDVLGVPVILENDANAGALGEAVYGSGAGYRRVFYVTISTSIGTGIVIDGEIYRGARGLAGEIWAFEPGAFCGGLGRGNINDLCGGAGMVREALRMMAEGAETAIEPGDISAQDIIAAWEKGDTVSRKVVRTARRNLAASICFAIHLLAPDLVALGGGLCTDPQWMLNPVKRLVRKWLTIEGLKKTRIRRARLWDNAVLYGAIALFGDKPRS